MVVTTIIPVTHDGGFSAVTVLRTVSMYYVMNMPEFQNSDSKNGVMIFRLF